MLANSEKRVVVTGVSLISPLGNSVQEAFNRLKIYKNCVKYDETLDGYKNLYTRLSSRVHDFIVPQNFTRKALRTMGKVSVFATASAQSALIDAGFIQDDKINPIIQNGETGVCYGSCSGSMEALMDFYSLYSNKEIGKLNSGSYIKMMPQTAAVNISLFFKTHGRLVTTSTACTSGSMAIGNAYELIKYGLQKVVIAGGAEEFDISQVGVFDTLYATSTKNDCPNLTPAPFDINRDGLVVGEGAGTLVLEEYEHAKARGAKIYAEVVGFSTNTDGTHITNPNRETMAAVIDCAIKCAKISKKDVGYVNAHGTGTKNGDIAESFATNDVLGKNMLISTVKSYTGHTLGACGAIEAILSIEMMNNNWFCPNLNLKEIDPDCASLDYIQNEGRTLETEFVVSNNFAFGGVNTSLVFKRA